MDGNPVDSGETGWVAEQHVGGEASPDQAAGLLWDIEADPPLTNEERAVVRREALRILEQDARCRTIVFGDRSIQRKGEFYVTCSPGPERPNYNVWFALKD
jgi:hypothetical protein